MPLYLTLSRGPRADRATPVLASSDPAVIDAVLRAIRDLGDPGDGEAAVASASATGWHLIGGDGTEPEDAPQ